MVLNRNNNWAGASCYGSTTPDPTLHARKRAPTHPTPLDKKLPTCTNLPHQLLPNKNYTTCSTHLTRHHPSGSATGPGQSCHSPPAPAAPNNHRPLHRCYCRRPPAQHPLQPPAFRDPCPSRHAGHSVGWVRERRAATHNTAHLPGACCPGAEGERNECCFRT